MRYEIYLKLKEHARKVKLKEYFGIKHESVNGLSEVNVTKDKEQVFQNCIKENLIEIRHEIH